MPPDAYETVRHFGDEKTPAPARAARSDPQRGEALANAGLVPPFWAMWGTNAILAAVGVYLLLRMGRDTTSNRGGDWGDRLDALKARFGRGPQAGTARGTPR